MARELSRRIRRYPFSLNGIACVQVSSDIGFGDKWTSIRVGDTLCGREVDCGNLWVLNHAHPAVAKCYIGLTQAESNQSFADFPWRVGSMPASAIYRYCVTVYNRPEAQGK